MIEIGDIFYYKEFNDGTIKYYVVISAYTHNQYKIYYLKSRNSPIISARTILGDTKLT